MGSITSISMMSILLTRSRERKKPTNLVNFNNLQSQNDEIYAWIEVDGTEVNYPIVQSTVDDEFYLTHSAYDKSWLASGAVFTQSQNTTTFNDAVTQMYGHTGFTGTCAWVDPVNELVYVFLSNRIYPDVTNRKLNQLHIRERIQGAIYDAMKKK